MPSSDGSVVVLFEPALTGDRIGFVGRVLAFNISNDITRGAADLLDLDDLVQNELGSLLDEALSTPDANLTLPPTLRALGVTLATARFETSDGLPSLVIEGTLPAIAALVFDL